MAQAVIVDSVRTGLAKSFRGGFNQTRADDMTAHIIDALMDRNPEIDPASEQIGKAKAMFEQVLPFQNQLGSQFEIFFKSANEIIERCDDVLLFSQKNNKNRACTNTYTYFITVFCAAARHRFRLARFWPAYVAHSRSRVCGYRWRYR